MLQAIDKSFSADVGCEENRTSSAWVVGAVRRLFCFLH